MGFKYSEKWMELLPLKQKAAVTEAFERFRMARIGDIVRAVYSGDYEDYNWIVTDIILYQDKTEYAHLRSVDGDGMSGLHTFFCRIYRDSKLIHDPGIEIPKILAVHDHPAVGRKTRLYTNEWFNQLDSNQRCAISSAAMAFDIAKTGDEMVASMYPDIRLPYFDDGMEHLIGNRLTVRSSSPYGVVSAGIHAWPAFFCKIFRNDVCIHDPDVEIAKILAAHDHHSGDEPALGRHEGEKFSYSPHQVSAVSAPGYKMAVGVKSDLSILTYQMPVPEPIDPPLHEALEASRRETENRRAQELAKQVAEREQRQRELENPYRTYMQADFQPHPDQDVDEYDCLVMAGDRISDAVAYLGKLASAGIPEALENLKSVHAIVKRQIRREEFKLRKAKPEETDGDQMVPF